MESKKEKKEEEYAAIRKRIHHQQKKKGEKVYDEIDIERGERTGKRSFHQSRAGRKRI